MNRLKEILKDASLFRKTYILTLLGCRIIFLQFPAYVFTAFCFAWGLGLVFYNQRRFKTFFKMRFGLWVAAFLAVMLLSMLVCFSVMLPVSFLFFLHALICFFVFYGLHTEPGLNFKKELGFIAKAIVYIVTVGNLLGLVFLLFGVHAMFEINLFGFLQAEMPLTVFENRFTGFFVNPNQLGFLSATALFCLHMLSKQRLRDEVGKIPNPWVVLCVIANAFSILLCDSNATFVLVLAYFIAYLAYSFFSQEKKFMTVFGTILRTASVIVISVVLVFSMLMFRTIFNTGFAAVTAQTNSLVDIIFRGENLINEFADEEPGGDGEIITFEHENKNIDSGRFKLWSEGVEIVKLSPVIGVGFGNIVHYSQTYLSGAFKFDLHHNDAHNGLLTIWMSTGTLGLVLFCIFGFRFAKHCAQHLFLKGKEYKEDLFPCMFSFLAAYIAYSFFEITLLYDVSYMVMFFWLIMGYASTYIIQKEQSLGERALFRTKTLKRTLL
ncbi:MAG TPA: hypothetical protein DEO32_05475 [Ruminococcaceae bacterium]|nr:hypothetical protein [Oscillospiraceae bacterium]